MTAADDVAIVGMGLRFPGAASPAAFWRMIEAGVDASSDAPAGRWPQAATAVVDPGAVGVPDRVPTARGYFLDVPASLPAGAAAGELDPLFGLVMAVGTEAFASCAHAAVDRRRAGIVLGNIALPTTRSSAAARALLGAAFAERAFGQAAAAPLPQAADLRPCALPAGLLAQALGFGGGSFTLDAACASSLVALKLAADALRDGEADFMLAGGVSRPDPYFTQLGFAQLRALAPGGRCRPLDSRASGLVVGEGAGIFALKRLGDALAAGDRIYGVLRGFGLANDAAGGILAPHSEGQLRAMRAAYAEAGWQPQDVDLVEAHATGTPLGDKVELESMAALWAGAGRPGGCVIGSVKANVGHLLTAAGASSVAKVLLAFAERRLPPTANFGVPSPALAAPESAFRVLTRAEPWAPRASGAPRRAAVNGFGFGGINAHVLIEEWLGEPVRRAPRQARVAPPRAVAVVGLASRVGAAGAPLGWWGSESTAWFRAHFAGSLPAAHRLAPLAVPAHLFRIPPVELAAMLPQQLLMLLVASAAARDAGLAHAARPRAGVFVGLGLDGGASDYGCRWTLAAQAAAWAAARGMAPDDPAVAAWQAALARAFGHELSADRVTGALAGVIGSRIARELGFCGPALTVSNDEASGLRALAVAAAAIRRGELDLALVGAVECAGQLSHVVAARLWADSQGTPPPLATADGAVALVLKEHALAIADGDRILALVDAASAAAACGRAAASAPRLSDEGGALVWREPDAALAEPYTGAAAGLFGAARAVAALRERLAGDTYWLHDRDQGARRAAVACSGADGSVLTVAFTESRLLAPAARDRLGPGHERYGLFLLAGATASALAEAKGRLAALASRLPAASPRALALAWYWSERPPGGGGVAPHRAAFVWESGRGPGFSALLAGLSLGAGPGGGDGLGARPAAPLALLFPGSGSYYPGMGGELAAAFPGVMDGQDEGLANLRTQFGAGRLARESRGAAPDFKTVLGAQCAHACFVTGVLTLFGVRPAAAIGYSLGESAALLALGAWPDRQGLFDRLMASDLFTSQLAGEQLALRRHWGLAADAPVTWANMLVQRSPAVVREALAGLPRAYLTNINTATECVIGGDRAELGVVLQRLGHAATALPPVPAMHSPVVAEVADAFRAFHTQPLAAPAGVRFYGGAAGEALALTSDVAAAAILAHAVGGVDYPRVVEQAYADGIRTFVEVGPGSSLTRMTRAILGGRPHVVLSLCPSASDELGSVYAALAACYALGHPLTLAPLFEATPVAGDTQPAPLMTVRLGAEGFAAVPQPPLAESPPAALPDTVSPPAAPKSPQPSPPLAGPPSLRAKAAPGGVPVGLIAGVVAAQRETGAAHSEQLSFAAAGLVGAAALMRRLAATAHAAGAPLLPLAPVVDQEAPLALPAPFNDAPAWLDHAACRELAVGSLGAVLGPSFAAADGFPTRVRLPAGPLLLCHRMMRVDAVPKSMGTGRLVTEHDVRADAWYLDGGRIPTGIAVEAGQADLFLAGYLGIDFLTQGRAVYRLLDAAVTFHRGLPAPGAVLRYEIRLHHFFYQGTTPLFRFSFEATADGAPLMSMERGCAGFFTAAELAAGKGLVKTALDLRPEAGRVTGGFLPLLPQAPAAYDGAQLDRLRLGDYAGCFGAAFAGVPAPPTPPLPGGMLRLVQRVIALEPQGGRFGLGRIVGEADVRPDAWYLTCHFVDDMVMPGTLMYESCLQTLRIFLLRLGWTQPLGDRWDPKPGVASRLKCRGQVLPTTRKIRYEIEIRELGYGPDAYALADATIYADDRGIVDIASMSLTAAGLTAAAASLNWSAASLPAATGAAPALPRPPAFTREQILAFATGKPSDCFGDAYRAFDGPDRRCPRLPRPPYQLLDRTVATGAAPFVMQAGGFIDAAYDVPADAWYFRAGGSGLMPYAALVEAALQPCGFYSSYMGAALTTSADLYYRNLGGSGVVHAPVTPESGTLATRVHCTQVSTSAGMIIHKFTFDVACAGRRVYTGETTFGFFTAAALALQIGLRQAPPHLLPVAGSAPPLPFPDRPHLARAPLLMVDDIVALDLTGGPLGLGIARGRKRIEPDEWFFAAHFYQDPVMPGSLGLEALFQLLTVVADARWPAAAAAGLEAPAAGTQHTWLYRGQVAPTCARLDFAVAVTAVDAAQGLLTADGVVCADGLPIYELRGLTVKAARPPA